MTEFFELKHRRSGAVIFSGDYGSIRECVEAAVQDGIILLGADLSGANLRGIDLSGANMRWANMRGADLRWANVSGADLTDANVSDANLRGANLRGADLSGANLRGIDLTRADLRGVHMPYASLSGANMDFSAWPLCCGSLNAVVDERIAAQLLYHVISVVQPHVRFTDDQIDFANTFHRVGEVPKLKKEA